MTKSQTITRLQFKEALEETKKDYLVWLSQMTSIEKRMEGRPLTPDADDRKESEKMQRRFERSAKTAFSSASPRASGSVKRLCAAIEKAGGGMVKQRTTGTTLSHYAPRHLFNHRFARQLEAKVHALTDPGPGTGLCHGGGRVRLTKMESNSRY